uniref:NADH-ubiquinone oxidoreductase chain 3 n=1 Tax=Laevapex fuscus TaxID=240816 RepID=A0A8F8AEY1_9GAST|nr:NADH dehydrogenase subunit 3 [Laevapex fuscus]
MMLYLFSCMVISFIMLMIFYFISFQSEKNSEKLTAFECGFDPLSMMRTPFSMRFFILVILFLVFDVEISLLFPLISMFSLAKTLFSLFLLTSFLTIILVSLFHEWNEGAIDWVSK